VSSSPLNLRLEHYEGPLDLLLDLIRKQHINIYDIPIASVTQQYLAYLDQAAQLDIELSADFVYMAATLIHIKSRLLLPRDPELDKIEPEDDPRKELVDRLLEHERFKGAAQMLQQKRMVEEAVWSNPQISQFEGEDTQPGLAVTLFDLVKTLEQVIDRARNRPLYEVSQDDVSVPDMMLFLKSRLKDSTRSEKVSVRNLFEAQRSRRAMVCLFLAILEMVKQHAVNLWQEELFGDILVRRGQHFDELQVSGEELAKIEEEYKS
jgi:segregation and condensation protein A